MMKKQKKEIRRSSLDDPKIRSEKSVKKTKRHSSKKNLKNIAQGNLDYDDYMATVYKFSSQ